MRYRIFVRVVAVFLTVLMLSATAFGIVFKSRMRARAIEMAEWMQLEERDKRVIVVRGGGLVNVEPDVAYLNIVVSSKGLDVEKTQGENAQIVDGLIAALTEIGIGKEDVKTAYYNVYPNYEYALGVNKQAGYVVSCSLRVQVEDFALLGKAIDAAGANGVNGISGVEFGIKDNAIAHEAAMANAIENAKNKASAIASAHGIALGEPVSIKELEAFDNKIMPFAARSISETAATTIMPSSLLINASVEITYLIG